MRIERLLRAGWAGMAIVVVGSLVRPATSAAQEGGAPADTAAAPAERADRGGEAVALTSPGTTVGVTVGTREVRSLAGKLEAFGESLSPEERLMMDWLLQRAGSAPPDDPAGTQVHGTLFTPPRVVSGAADAAGIDSDAADPGAGEPGSEPPAEEPATSTEEGEPTMALTPAPPAALARALGMNLLEMEGPPAGTQAPR